MGMLEVNPAKRWTADQCLKNPYFDNIRQPLIEKPAASKLMLDIDRNDAFDYSLALSKKYTK